MANCPPIKAEEPYLFSQFMMDDVYYDKREMDKLALSVKNQTGVDMIFVKSREYNRYEVTFESGIDNEGFFIMLHPTIMTNFGFERNVIKTFQFDHPEKLNLENIDPATGSYATNVTNVTSIGGTLHYEREFNYKGEKYFVYYVSKDPVYHPTKTTEIVSYKSKKLKSGPFLIDTKVYPNLIKFVCDAIQPQILNSTFSNDLLVYSPTFKKKKVIFIEMSNPSITFRY